MGSRDTKEAEGERRIRKRPAFSLPNKGKVKRYLLTCAQNNTKLHDQLWSNLSRFAAHIDAPLFVATFTYSKATLGSKGAKRKTAKEQDNDREWWDERINDHILDESVELAPGLVWCGELQILPTAVNPISGMESYTGRSSSIIPHTKFAVHCVPSPKHAGTKFIYTTGTVTLRNYIQKKAGQKASFHHGYGALIVEVDSDGNWFVRQLNADSEGTFYDFDTQIKDGKVTFGLMPEAIVWGDLHECELETEMRALCWGEGGILDTLRPKRQVVHDLLDFHSQKYHDRDDPWKMFEKYLAKELNVRTEIRHSKNLLKMMSRKWCETVIVHSNHDEMFTRWLKDGDFRADPRNTKFFLQANLAAYRWMSHRPRQSFHPLEWACGLSEGWRIKFLRQDEPYIVCPDAHGGVELGMHGHKGANGGKGSLRTFARTGRKSIIGHSHTAGHIEGAMQVGVMAKLDQGYNQGMSSWSHTNALVYPNGKRTLFTIWNGKWRA